MFDNILEWRAVRRSALCRSPRELSQKHSLTNVGFDTAENEPCKVCPLAVYRSSSLLLQTPPRLLFLANCALLAAFTAVLRAATLGRAGTLDALGHVRLEGDLKWDKRTTIRYPAVCTILSFFSNPGLERICSNFF